MKNKNIKSFGEFDENFNISGVSDSNSKNFTNLALKYYNVVTRIKQPFVNRITINDKMIVYHGGGEISSDVITPPIFTTSDKDVAKWYGCTSIRGIGKSRKSYDIGFVTTLQISVKNYLRLENAGDFKEKWIPLLKDAKIEYEFQEYENSYKFRCDLIESFGGPNLSPLDLCYIPRFNKSVKDSGYDTIIGLDSLNKYKIQTNIPLYTENIKFIECEEIT